MIASNASWGRGICKECGYTCIGTQATEQYKDYWYYCSNKQCKNHEGTQVDDSEWPDWIDDYRYLRVKATYIGPDGLNGHKHGNEYKLTMLSSGESAWIMVQEEETIQGKIPYSNMFNLLDYWSNITKV